MSAHYWSAQNNITLTAIILSMTYISLHYHLLLLLKAVGSAKLGESDLRPVSLKTPASQ